MTPMSSRLRLTAAAAAIGLAAAPQAWAQASRATPGQPEARTALELMAPVGRPGRTRLKVASPSFQNGGRIAFEYTQYRNNTFPGLTWSRGPHGVRSYAIIMQDNTLIYHGGPVLHWTMFNIPAGVTSLPTGMAPEGKPAGSSYGPNFKGAARPYTGPRTPPGPGDDYHFEVFALDAAVPAEASSDYAVLIRAMQGHVLASGEVVGHAIADPDAPPRPPPAPPAPSAAPVKPPG